MSDTPTTRATSDASAVSRDGAARSEAKAAAEPVTFREKLEAGRFVVSVEVDPPHGLGARKAIQGTQLLKDAGVDVINVGDTVAGDAGPGSYFSIHAVWGDQFNSVSAKLAIQFVGVIGT